MEIPRYQRQPVQWEDLNRQEAKYGDHEIPEAARAVGRPK
jgi:hypothetical protein